MPSRISLAYEDSKWKKAYTAVVLEQNRALVPELIEEANQELRSRLRELLVLGPVPCIEAEAIHDALYMLAALRSIILHRRNDPEG